jgi:hypothetical protein
LSEQHDLRLDGHGLTVEDVVEVARGDAHIELAPSALVR